MTGKKRTTKKPSVAKKGAATTTTSAAAAANARTARKAGLVAGEGNMRRKKTSQSMPADTGSQKPARTRGTTAAKIASAMPSPEQRYRMVQASAYFLAEKDGFQGPAAHYWALAEREIAAQLGESETQG